jgi:acetyl esterase/lipase
MQKRRNFLKSISAGLAVVSVHARCTASETSPEPGKPVTWILWPGKAPGEIKELPPEADTTAPDGNLVAGRRVIRLGNVSTPTITIYKPDPSIDTGTAIVVCPGGGFNILAMDLEGSEVAEWLNLIGVTAIVLKYRVPGRERDPERRWFCAVQDAQRAMSMVRSRADEIGFKPDKLGLMGFSAGASTTSITTFIQERLYEPIDEYDTVSWKPDFAAPIYGGSLPDEVEIGSDAPPIFLAIAHDDKPPRALLVAEFYMKLNRAGVSAELHVYESGGHGYGLRRTKQPVTSWNDRMEEWMRYLKLLER